MPVRWWAAMWAVPCSVFSRQEKWKLDELGLPGSQAVLSAPCSLLQM